jgi:hypothetical protein
MEKMSGARTAPKVDAFDLFDDAGCHAAEQSRLEGFAVE